MKYLHKEDLHNLNDPGIIIPLLYELYPFKSLVDVGCGLGTFIKVAQDKYQITDTLGLDGAWVNKEMLFKNLKNDHFLEVDLEKEISLGRKFDVAISLEVAEHLAPSAADLFVRSLTNLSDVILFSAAIPFQLGDNHLNEQWPNYWKTKFESEGYSFFDVIRPKIWNNEKLFWWYKQNIFLVIKNEHPLASSHTPVKDIMNVVHPDVLRDRSMELTRIKSGNRGISFYSNLLWKGIRTKVGI